MTKTICQLRDNGNTAFILAISKSSHNENQKYLLHDSVVSFQNTAFVFLFKNNYR